jgi:cellulose synthase (UDP-forming)
VFVPSYNEDSHLLANTLSAAKAMDYPADKLHVWLLDDGGTLQKRNSNKLLEAQAAVGRHNELKQLCEDSASLSDARPQRTRQGRQSQQRHEAFDR